MYKLYGSLLYCGARFLAPQLFSNMIYGYYRYDNYFEGGEEREMNRGEQKKRGEREKR